MSEALLTPNEKRYRYLQYQLKLRQITLAQIAQDLDVSIGHVQRTLQGHRQSPRIRAKLVDLLGCDVSGSGLQRLSQGSTGGRLDIPRRKSSLYPRHSVNDFFLH